VTGLPPQDEGSPASTPAPAESAGAARLTTAAAEVWSIAWPTVLTMTSYTVMQFTDKLMVGRVGPVEVAAQGNGAIWSFAPIAFAMGVLTVVNTFVSQNLGAGRAHLAPRYAWAAVWLSAIIWFLVMIPWATILGDVFALMHAAPLEHAQAAVADGAIAAQTEIDRIEHLLRLETRYARILLAGSIALLIGRGIHQYFFGLHRPRVVAIAAITGNLVNVATNYALIYGAAGLVVTDANGAERFHLPGVPGAPALGLDGAAIGTVAGTLVEMAIPLAIFLGPRMNRELRTRAQWRPASAPLRDLLRVGWPASVQFGNELLCWSIFMTALVGLFGTHHQTAGWIAVGYMHLSFMPANGFSVAVTSLVGRHVGAGRPDIAMHRARVGVAMATAYMTLCAAVFIIFRGSLVEAFVGGPDLRPEDAAAIVKIGTRLMICAAAFQTLDAFGIVYTGALRGAGDTVWPGVMTILYSWAFLVAGGWLMTRIWPELESIGPWLGATAYIVVYGLTMAARFESGRWRAIDLLGRGSARN
jgi:MATE family multidrug resistance protein